MKRHTLIDIDVQDDDETKCSPSCCWFRFFPPDMPDDDDQDDMLLNWCAILDAPIRDFKRTRMCMKAEALYDALREDQ